MFTDNQSFSFEQSNFGIDKLRQKMDCLYATFNHLQNCLNELKDIREQVASAYQTQDLNNECTE